MNNTLTTRNNKVLDMSKINLIIYWSPSKFYADGYSFGAIDKVVWERSFIDSDDYHFIMEIEVPEPDKEAILNGIISGIDSKVVEKKHEIKLLEDKKASLLAIEHKS